MLLCQVESSSTFPERISGKPLFNEIEKRHHISSWPWETSRLTASEILTEDRRIWTANPQKTVFEWWHTLYEYERGSLASLSQEVAVHLHHTISLVAQRENHSTLFSEGCLNESVPPCGQQCQKHLSKIHQPKTKTLPQSCVCSASLKDTLKMKAYPHTGSEAVSVANIDWKGDPHDWTFLYIKKNIPCRKLDFQKIH